MEVLEFGFPLEALRDFVHWLFRQELQEAGHEFLVVRHQSDGFGQLDQVPGQQVNALNRPTLFVDIAGCWDRLSLFGITDNQRVGWCQKLGFCK